MRPVMLDPTDESPVPSEISEQSSNEDDDSQTSELDTDHETSRPIRRRLRKGQCRIDDSDSNPESPRNKQLDPAGEMVKRLKLAKSVWSSPFSEQAIEENSAMPCDSRCVPLLQNRYHLLRLQKLAMDEGVTRETSMKS